VLPPRWTGARSKNLLLPSGLVRSAVKAAAAGYDVLRRPRSGVVVLIYHRIGGTSRSQVDLPASVFDAHMSELAARGSLVALGDTLDWLSNERDGTSPCVVVTFDDGTADFADVALPILERHRVPVTLYVATAFVEESRQFPWGASPLSWQALADACATGLVDVGSHTHRHRLLDRLAPADVADELDRSRALIEDRLGRRAEHFAYPKAVPASAHADRLVRQRFRSAAVAGTRANAFGATDVHRLARSPIQVSDGLRWFRRKVAGGMAFEDMMRRALNRRRYAGIDA